MSQDTPDLGRLISILPTEVTFLSYRKLKLSSPFFFWLSGQPHIAAVQYSKTKFAIRQYLAEKGVVKLHFAKIMMNENEELKIETVEMHTGGEPLRIIISGYPKIGGKTLLEKRRYVKENLDHLRKFLMFEPRGHYDQYGALLVEPDNIDADIAVIFMHNEGYSTMCGHAIIALGRFAIDYNYVKPEPIKQEIPEQEKRSYQVKIQCPCGLVKAEVERQDGKTGSVTFISVPAFAFAIDKVVETEKYGSIVVDIGYGGAFYALVSADRLGLNVSTSPVRDLVDAAQVISAAVKTQVRIIHPEEPDLSFLYGTIITDGSDDYCSEPTSNLCVFADKQVDRSPTGSGVTARIAVQYAKKQIPLHTKRVFVNGPVKSKFTGQAIKETKCGSIPAVQVEVSGSAFYTGKSMFTFEKNDPLKHGFLVQ